MTTVLNSIKPLAPVNQGPQAKNLVRHCAQAL
jgi:hypothetical protein